MSLVTRHIIGYSIFAVALISSVSFASALDFDREEFRSVWRQKGTGNKISFDKVKRSFAVEFGGKYLQFNTSNASYSHCDEGRDGGADLCISGRLFDCAFLVTLSTWARAALPSAGKRPAARPLSELTDVSTWNSPPPVDRRRFGFARPVHARKKLCSQRRIKRRVRFRRTAAQAAVTSG